MPWNSFLCFVYSTISDMLQDTQESALLLSNLTWQIMMHRTVFEYANVNMI